MSPSATFSHRRAGGGCQAVLTLMALFPVMALGHLVEPLVGRLVPTVALFGLLALAAAFYRLVRIEARLSIDDASVRLIEQESVFGSVRPAAELWTFPVPDLTEATEVTTKTPSSRGGWNYGHAVHFAGGQVVRADQLGGRGTGDTPYDQLVAHLRARLGNSFRTEERIG